MDTFLGDDDFFGRAILIGINFVLRLATTSFLGIGISLESFLASIFDLINLLEFSYSCYFYDLLVFRCSVCLLFSFYGFSFGKLA